MLPKLPKSAYKSSYQRGLSRAGIPGEKEHLVISSRKKKIAPLRHGLLLLRSGYVLEILPYQIR